MKLFQKAPPLKHIAIIMDGNRRWARKQGLSAISGHEYVVDHVIEPLVDRCIELKIPYLTMWAFSTENWERDERELTGMMRLFRKAFERKVQELHEKGVRLNILGEIDRFPKDIAEKAKQWVEISRKNTTITLNFALNYGGRDELIRGMWELFSKLSKKKEASGVTMDAFQSCLDTADMPDPDLIIRPGGQLRLSGFMPWQSVYSELYFTEVLMPEFTVQELDKAIADFSSRKRRFGR